MVVVALILGMIAGGFLSYELIALLEKIREKNEGDKHVE